MNHSNVHQQHHGGFPLSYAQNQINQHNQYRADFDNIRQSAAQVEHHVVRVVNEQMNAAATLSHPANIHNPNAHVHFPASQAVIDNESDEEEEDGRRHDNNDREDFDDEEGGVHGEEEHNEEDDLNKRD